MPQWQRWKNIMKCYPFEEKRLAKWSPPFIVQPKYDGFRCRAVPLETGWLLLSSAENPIFSVPHINQSLTNQQIPEMELDGELYFHGMSFDEISSILSRTKNLHPDYQKIQFHIFDYVSDEIQTQRILRLEDINLDPPLIKSPYWLCNTLEDIMSVFNELIVLGYEGIIVRNFVAPYERKRSTMIMKFKPKQEDTYAILGYEEEISINNNPKGRLGALICASGDGEVFNVGTGFTDDQRKLLWSSRDKLAGKVVRIQYQHITPGRKVPRFPVFVEVI